MKILHVANYIPGYHRQSGGAERAFLNTVQLLHEKGEENIVTAVKPLIRPREKEFKFFPIVISEDVLGYKLSFLKRIFNFDIVSYLSLKKILKKTRPDIMHLYNFDLISLSAIAAAKSLKIPIVFSVYDYWIFSSDKGITFNDGLWRRMIFRVFFKKIDAFIVLSEHSQKLLMEKGVSQEKIHLIHLIMPENNHLFDDKEEEENTMLFAGWIQPRKGLLVLINAMPEIIKKLPQIKLYISGLKEDIDYREKIDNFISANNLENYIEWNNTADKLNDKKKYISFFKKAKVVIVPEQWQNMSPVIIAESLKARKAVVASNIGGIPDIIQDGISGILFKCDDPSDLADKIAELFLNPRTHEKIKEGGRKRYEQLFNARENVGELIEIYKRLIKY